MAPIPRDRIPDSTLAFLFQGYGFISNRCRRHQSDIFETRLMLRRTLCMLGEPAARLFYDGERFQRSGAAPERLLKTLFGEGGVQALDGADHRHRKAMFLSLTTPEQVQRLLTHTAAQWNADLVAWENAQRIVWFHELQELFFKAACAWAGIDLPAARVKDKMWEITSMIDGSGGVGPRYWRARMGRKRMEKWIGFRIEAVRAGSLNPAPDTALAVVAGHRDTDGRLLKPHVASVELLNVLRPIVAVARFVTFAAMALETHPGHAARLRGDDDEFLELFVQEVRRFYPFFPAVAARVRKTFTWNGYRFDRGTRVLLDLFGTNHDPRLWDRPERFRPFRFRNWNGGAFNFIPQGGGDHAAGHRCPGEWITIALMKQALVFMVGRMIYDVPKQDLRVRLSRMPAIPRSRFVVQNVRRSVQSSSD